MKFRNNKKLEVYSDEELLDLYLKERKSKYFTELYSRNIIGVYRFVYSKVQNKEVAEDITSQTFTIFVNSIEKFNHKSKVSTFIKGIALNKVRQHWDKIKRAKKVEYLDEFDYESLSESVSNELYKPDDELLKEEEKINETVTLLDSILEQLKPSYRDVLRERFINQRNIKETAEKLGLTEGNVRIIQHRALQKAQKIALNNET